MSIRVFTSDGSEKVSVKAEAVEAVYGSASLSTGNQSVSAGAAVSWQSGTTGWWSASQPTRLTVPLDGLYLATASIGFTTSAARLVTIRTNGVGFIGTANHTAEDYVLVGIYAMTAGQYFDVMTNVASTAKQYSRFTVVRLGDA